MTASTQPDDDQAPQQQDPDDQLQLLPATNGNGYVDPSMLARPHEKRRQQGRRVQILERQARVMKAYTEGQTQVQIAAAEHLTQAMISKDIKAAMERMRAGISLDAQAYRQTHLLRMQQALGHIWLKVRKGDLDAIRVMLKLMEREAALLGLDAPTKIDIEATIRAMAVQEGWDPDDAVREAETARQELLRIGAA